MAVIIVGKSKDKVPEKKPEVCVRMSKVLQTMRTQKYAHSGKGLTINSCFLTYLKAHVHAHTSTQMYTSSAKARSCLREQAWVYANKTANRLTRILLWDTVQWDWSICGKVYSKQSFMFYWWQKCYALRVISYYSFVIEIFVSDLSTGQLNEVNKWNKILANIIILLPIYHTASTYKPLDLLWLQGIKNWKSAF